MDTGCGVLLWAVLLLASLSCSESLRGDEDPPAQPLVCRGVPATQAREVGIDAIPEADAVRVEWIVGDEPDLDGYEIYRRVHGDATDTLVASVPIQWTEGDTAFWLDGEVSLGKRYYYRIRALDEAGNRSSPSEAVDYLLLAKLIPQSPIGQVVQRVPTFTFLWGDDPLGMTCFVVKVTDNAGGYLWISSPEYGLVVGYEKPGSIRFNADATATTQELGPGAYRWRVDGVGAEDHSGSESRWVSFTVE